MHLGTFFYTLFCGKLVGKDIFGNKYYQAKKSKSVKRWVVYNGIAEPSKVPPEWHGWLHYITDEIPNKKYKWQKEHLPNRTGTVFAYLPSGHLAKGGKRKKACGDYESWQPNN